MSNIRTPKNLHTTKRREKAKIVKCTATKQSKKALLGGFTVKIDGIEEKDVALIIETLEESKKG